MDGNKHQWNLKALFIVPLFLSPLFLSAHLTGRRYFDYYYNPDLDATTIFNVLACAAIYAGIFAARSGLRQRWIAAPSKRFVLRGAAIGARFGLLFMGLAVAPALVGEAVYRVKDDRVLPLLPLLWVAGIFIAVFGTFLGAFGGSAAGILLELAARRHAITRRGR